MTDRKKEQPDPERNVTIRPRLLSWAVFVPTAIIVLLCLLSVVFPALLIRSTSQIQGSIAGQNFIDPLQPGILAAPLIIVNVIIVGIGFFYYKKKEQKCRDIISKITSFEVSKKQALVGIIIFLAIFAGVTGGTLAKEETWVDYKAVKERVQSWSISDFANSFEPHVRYFLLSASLNIFGNIRVVPFITSLALLILTYFFTKNITGKRFAGLVSTGLLLQSNIFTAYGTAASYDNSWILLYLFGLYLIQKFWPPSPVSYFLSIFSKALTVAFLPMTFYFVARSNIPKRSKIISLISYGIVAMILVIAASFLNTNLTGNSSSTNASEFWQGFSAMAIQMRFDYVIVLFLLPVTVMLFFASRRGILHADSMMIFILTILLASPFLLVFTSQTNQPYRFVSLTVFFAISVGVLLSKKTRKQDELQSSMQ